MHDVSPFCQYWLCVVMVRVTLHELSPNAAPNAVNAAISTEMTILMICCLLITVRFFCVFPSNIHTPFKIVSLCQTITCKKNEGDRI